MDSRGLVDAQLHSICADTVPWSHLARKARERLVAAARTWTWTEFWPCGSQAHRLFRLESLSRKRRTLVLASLGFLGILSLAQPSFAQHADHIYCVQHTDGGQQSIEPIAYYTDIFIGNYIHSTAYENDFSNYLRGNEQGHFFFNSFCFFERTREEAEADFSHHATQSEYAGYRVIRTGWSPMSASAPEAGERSFTPQPIRDFAISVPSSPYDVQVCVRDHECEDGDRVRVSVNGSTLLAEEIVNEWSCRQVSLGEGQHDIELYAVNGTGYKGDCSYADENTGELRVTGADSQTQSWRHRGGAGSSANIEVTIQ